MSKFSLMKTIDQSLNKAVASLDRSNLMQQVYDFYDSLEEQFQQVFKLIILFFVVLIPSIFAIISYSYYSSQVSALEVNEKILLEANKLLNQKGDITKIEKKFLGQNFVEQSAFQSRLVSALERYGINTSSVQISDYRTDEISKNLQEMTTRLKVSSFSNDNLFQFLRVVTVELKAQVEEIDVRKNNKTNLISGTVKIIHLSKVVAEKQ